MALRVLFIGEIVGRAGIFCVKSMLPDLRKELQVDFVIANGDGVTGGFGIGKNHSIYLRKLGIDVITTGDQVYFKKDMVQHIDRAHYILRPANFPMSNPGRGWRFYTVNDSGRADDTRQAARTVAVVSYLGQSGFNRTHLGNPFSSLVGLVDRIRRDCKTIILDFHAVTTAEKSSMFHHADGIVSAVIGTGTRVLTADAAVLPGGTGVISDAGRTGSVNSVSGLDPSIEIQKFLRQIPERSKDAWDNLELQGVLLEIDEEGRTTRIDTIREKCAEVPKSDGDGTRNED